MASRERLRVDLGLLLVLALMAAAIGMAVLGGNARPGPRHTAFSGADRPSAGSPRMPGGHGTGHPEFRAGR